MKTLRSLALMALAVLVGACASKLPEPRPDVDAALEQLRSKEWRDVGPLRSELVERAWKRDDKDPSHEVILLHTGADALTARAHLIRSALQSIDVQVFAWEQDEAGEFLLFLLHDAARRGVHVRILVDQLANQGRNGIARFCATHEKLELRFYNPVGRSATISTQTLLREVGASFGRMNQRMHNKVMVIDGRVVIVGGRNVGEPYFDMDTKFNYLDRDALVVGPAAGEAQDSFDQYWNWPRTISAAYMDDVAEEILSWEAGKPIPPLQIPELPRYEWARRRSGRYGVLDVMPHSRLHRVGRVDFIADLPGKASPEEPSPGERRREQEYEEHQAREYLLIQSNYLVLSEARIRSLATVAEERPELQLSYLTNSLAATANNMVYGVSRKQRTRILGLGLEVSEMRPLPADIRHLCPRYDALVAESRELAEADFEYEDLIIEDETLGPQFAIHAKSVVFDGRLALVSSHNIDPRSDALNTEAGVLIWDEEVTRELESELRLLMSNPNSWRSAQDSRTPVLSPINDAFTAFFRGLPVFDIWPIRNYGNYELREGAEAVPSRDPSFHERYRSVGEFPEVDSSGKLWQTRFYSVFGGLIRDLL